MVLCCLVLNFVLFNFKVILETLRLATIVNGVLRKTTNDMEVNGKCLIYQATMSPKRTLKFT